MPIMRDFPLKGDFIVLKCGKVRGKCAKLSILQGWKSENFNFSTHMTRGKVEKEGLNSTFAENQDVEKNKFSFFYLTENIQKQGEYSLLCDLFLYKLHKNQSFLNNIRAPPTKKARDTKMCSMYIFIE